MIGVVLCLLLVAILYPRAPLRFDPHDEPDRT